MEWSVSTVIARPEAGVSRRTPAFTAFFEVARERDLAGPSRFCAGILIYAGRGVSWVHSSAGTLKPSNDGVTLGCNVDSCAGLHVSRIGYLESTPQ